MVKQGTLGALLISVVLGLSLPMSAMARDGHPQRRPLQHRNPHGHYLKQREHGYGHQRQRLRHFKHYPGHRPNFWFGIFFDSRLYHHAPPAYPYYGPKHRQVHVVLETVPSGTSVAWHNPDSGYSGTLTPIRTYQTASGQYCREYQQTVMIGGEHRRAYGTACRQPDGSWKTVNGVDD